MSALTSDDLLVYLSLSVSLSVCLSLYTCAVPRLAAVLFCVLKNIFGRCDQNAQCPTKMLHFAIVLQIDLFIMSCSLFSCNLC